MEKVANFLGYWYCIYMYSLFFWFSPSLTLSKQNSNNVHSISNHCINYQTQSLMFLNLFLMYRFICRKWLDFIESREKAKALTKWTKSLAAIARMSAQDTTPGHLLSTNALAFLMLSNASGLRPLLSTASFSAATLLPGFVDIRIDPSQPCHFQELSQNPGNWNWLHNACSKM